MWCFCDTIFRLLRLKSILNRCLAMRSEGEAWETLWSNVASCSPVGVLVMRDKYNTFMVLPTVLSYLMCGICGNKRHQKHELNYGITLRSHITQTQKRTVEFHNHTTQTHNHTMQTLNLTTQSYYATILHKHRN